MQKKMIRTAPGRKEQREGKIGQILILAAIFLVLVLFLVTSFIASNLATRQGVRRDVAERQVLAIAQGGLEKTIFCLNEKVGTNCGGTFGQNYTGESNVSAGTGVFATTVTTVDSMTKTIEVRSDIPNATSPRSSGTLRATATISTANIAFNYGVQVGEGGVTMQNNADINGSVYSNGSITGGNGSDITGDAWVAAGSQATSDQEWTTQNADFAFGTTVSGAKRNDAAQRFKPSGNHPLTKVSLYLTKVGSPPNATVRIIRDENGSPSDKNGDVLASGTLQAANVTGSYGWVDVTFDVNPDVHDDKYYWLLVDAGNSNSNYWVWGRDSNDGYPHGTGKYSEDWQKKPWNAAGGDLDFKVWLGGVATKLDTVHVGTDAHAHTITGSTIDRDAYYQTITNSTVGGTQYPGSADPPPQAMPISDGQITAWKDEAATGGILNDGDDGVVDGQYTPTDNQALGPVKINTNLNLTTNNMTIRVNGTVYVTGNIDVANGVSILLGTGYIGNSSVILADGWIHIGNGTLAGGSGPVTYIMLLSTASGGGHHDSAIDIHNTASGVIFYAQRGLVNLHNNVSVKQVTAYKLSLSENASVSYETGLADTRFSQGPGASWTVKAGSWRKIR